MRKIIEFQLQFDHISIPDIKINLQYRDEIPKIFIGLQVQGKKINLTAGIHVVFRGLNLFFNA